MHDNECILPPSSTLSRDTVTRLEAVRETWLRRAADERREPARDVAERMLAYQRECEARAAAQVSSLTLFGLVFRFVLVSGLEEDRPLQGSTRLIIAVGLSVFGAHSIAIYAAVASADADAASADVAAAAAAKNGR